MEGFFTGYQSNTPVFHKIAIMDSQVLLSFLDSLFSALGGSHV
jgi:hypothetical protein